MAPIQIIGIILITLGSYCLRQIWKEARPNFHRWLLMVNSTTKVTQEEVVIYAIIVVFAEICYLTVLYQWFGFWVALGVMVAIHFLEDAVYTPLEERYPLRYLYRVSQATVPLGTLLLFAK